MAAVAALLCSGSAQATVYVVDMAVGGVAVKGSITTDGTIGRIDAGNIVSYTFNFKLPRSGFYDAVNVSFTGTSDWITQNGDIWLTATATDLNYVPQPVSSGRNPIGFVFDDPNQVASFCIQGRNCYSSSTRPGFYIYRANQASAPAYSTTFTGTRSLGRAVTVPAVPEPATWAMMLAGFGVVGYAMRARRRVAFSMV